MANNLSIVLAGTITFNLVGGVVLGYGLQKVFGSIEVI